MNCIIDYYWINISNNSIVIDKKQELNVLKTVNGFTILKQESSITFIIESKINQPVFVPRFNTILSILAFFWQHNSFQIDKMNCKTWNIFVLIFYNYLKGKFISVSWKSRCFSFIADLNQISCGVQTTEWVIDAVFHS